MTLDQQEGEGLIAYRLRSLETTVSGAAGKMDEVLIKINDQRDKLNLHDLRISNLEKSRDRLIVGLTSLTTGVILIGAQQIFGIFGGN